MRWLPHGYQQRETVVDNFVREDLEFCAFHYKSSAAPPMRTGPRGSPPLRSRGPCLIERMHKTELPSHLVGLAVRS